MSFMVGLKAYQSSIQKHLAYFMKVKPTDADMTAAKKEFDAATVPSYTDCVSENKDDKKDDKKTDDKKTDDKKTDDKKSRRLQAVQPTKPTNVEVNKSWNWKTYVNNG